MKIQLDGEAWDWYKRNECSFVCFFFMFLFLDCFVCFYFLLLPLVCAFQASLRHAEF